eukprot:976586-Pleurochrysis_carterae.AAC.1
MLRTVSQLGTLRATTLGTAFSLVQLDDGWQSEWGDWDTPHPTRFPNGIKIIADAVRTAGMTPGLWLAPAALVARSAIAKRHPEWVLRDARGKPVRCGFTAPGIWLHALDVSHPEALAHVAKVVRTVVTEWGYKYLKCDFLHCAAVRGGVRYDPSVGRAECLARLMKVRGGALC